ncbi:MAG: hypothetical protein ACP5H0_07745 [Caldisericum sp.]|uniref:hypothetical protein n=1 Tax=Caldisericum sp. TaxID=2499687 RepID=UPI003D0E0D0D
MKVWAYIHPRLNTLCCALLKESVPEGVSAVEFEIGDPSQINDIIYDGTNIRLKTLEEKLQKKKDELQEMRKRRLENIFLMTDYVIIKLNDLKMQLDLGAITSDDYNAEFQKYQPILQNRLNIRKWNDSIKLRIQNATTLEDLDLIKEEIISYTEQFKEVSSFEV